MNYFSRLSLLTASAGLFLGLGGCEDGTDFGPGTPDIDVVIENNIPQAAAPASGGGDGGGDADDGSDTVAGQPIGPGLVDNPNDPIPTGALIGKVASDDGASATGDTPAPAPANSDPFSIEAFFSGINADPALNNSTDVRGLIDSSGLPIGSPSALTAAFSVPGSWPPASADDATSLSVPNYITNTTYIGALEPGVPRDQQWTADWTIALNGNDAVWTFHGGAPGTALENAAAPVADGSCPEGTSLAGSFSDLVGPLANDAAGLFTGNAGEGDYDICTLAARYDSDGQVLTLTNDNVYNVADGFPGTKIGNGDLDSSNDPAAVPSITLEVEAGTLIYGEPQEALIVTRGSTVDIAGSQSAPVVMTSLRQLELRFDGDPATLDGSQQGEWAGFALMGFARNNQCGANFEGCNVLAEGGIGNYGGNDEEGSSGSVNYLVIRHAGNDLDGQGNELNGFSLFSVGRNTTLRNVQIHRGFDDGVEFFGGSAFIRNLVLTGNGDDSLDYDSGWTGGAQNVLIIQEGGPRAITVSRRIEICQEPITFELLSNVTIIGPAQRAASNDASGDEGIRFREGETRPGARFRS
ncbi:MAG: hypothetical protein U5O39_16930 [Gammaproteobacteria bacterium]|nr:hypothetical protein [Gammaproteobacteria bacterium]